MNNTNVVFNGILTVEFNNDTLGCDLIKQDIERELDKRDMNLVPLMAQDLHITLLSKRDFTNENEKLAKDLFDCFKEVDFSNPNLPVFPEVFFSNPYVAYNGKTTTLVVDLDDASQEAVYLWLEQLCQALNTHYEWVHSATRVFHVSLANETGSKVDSVSDPWNHRT